jgi:hypothetical protein
MIKSTLFLAAVAVVFLTAFIYLPRMISTIRENNIRIREQEERIRILRAQAKEAEERADNEQILHPPTSRKDSA